MKGCCSGVLDGVLRSWAWIYYGTFKSCHRRVAPQGSPFTLDVKRKLRLHSGMFHCCSFCSSGGAKEARCGCPGTMPGTRTWSEQPISGRVFIQVAQNTELEIKKEKKKKKKKSFTCPGGHVGRPDGGSSSRHSLSLWTIIISVCTLWLNGPVNITHLSNVPFTEGSSV